MLFNSNSFYQIGEIANVLGISRRTVARRIEAGDLPPAHPGLRRVRGRDLNLCIAQRRPWRDIVEAMSGDPMLDETTALQLPDGRRP